MAVYPTKENWIVRTESLWEDVHHANELLLLRRPSSEDDHNTTTPTSTTRTRTTSTTTLNTSDDRSHNTTAPLPPPLPIMRNITHGSGSYKTNPRQVYLSPLALQYLCDALIDELEIYKQLIQLATNLLPHQKEATLLRLEQQCPQRLS
jgi:hypothetical protein